MKKPAFIIFCDINMPRLNGLNLKQQIDDNPILRQKSIPFVFYTTSAGSNVVSNAYQKLTIQGLFLKQTEMVKIHSTLKMILDYWDIAHVIRILYCSSEAQM